MWSGDTYDDDWQFESADFERRLHREMQYEYSEEGNRDKNDSPCVNVKLTYTPTLGVICKISLKKAKRARSPCTFTD